MSLAVRGTGNISNASTSKDNIDLIMKELRKLEDKGDSIPGFHKERALLRRKLNNERDLTRNLPPETMSAIFEWYKDLNLSEEFIEPEIILKLGHITHDWRQIVWSTPQLWTELSVIVEKIDTIHSILNLLRLYLHNVRGLPFFLDMILRRPMIQLEEAPPHALLKLISDKENAEKIQSLELSNPPRALMPLLSSGNFSRLQHLHISGCNSKDFVLKALPQLRSLELEEVVLGGIELPWSTITSIDFFGRPVDMCINMLVQSTNLVKAYINFGDQDPLILSDTSEFPWMDSTDTITFPNLEILAWGYCSSPAWLALSERIRAPSLKTLTWEGKFEGPDEQPFRPILEGHFRSITALELEKLELCSHSFFQRIFSHTEQLEALFLSVCDETSIKSMFSVLESEQGTEQPVTYLPLLSQLEIRPARYDVWLSSEWAWKIFKLLERQWDAGISKFGLHVGGNSLDIEWEEVEGPLQKLVEKGFELRIFDEDEHVPWLNVIHYH